MKTKDAGLRIRIDRELREAFVAACRQEDRPAAQVLREFMRGYVIAHPQIEDGGTQPPKQGRKSSND